MLQNVLYGVLLCLHVKTEESDKRLGEGNGFYM